MLIQKTPPRDSRTKISLTIFALLIVIRNLENNPDDFVGPTDSHQIVGGSNDLYTCPMHPEIEQKGPGSCPICGMALEPKEVTAEEPINHELVDFTKRLKV